MKGSLKEIPFSDIVQLMVMGKKTGKLSVTNGEDFLELYFKSGVLIYGKMINREEKVGEMLFQKGVITEEILKKAEKEIEKGALNMGDALLKAGVDEEEIKKVYIEEVKKFIQEALLWEEGFFNFDPDEFPKVRPLISLDPSILLLESAKQLDEWKKIQEVLPSLDLICVVKKPSYIPESEIEKEIVSLVDNRKTVREILENIKYPLFESAEAMKDLIFKEVIELKEQKEREKLAKEKALEHLNLGFAFLKTGLYDEAEREFRRLYDITESRAEGAFYMGLLYIYRKNFDEAEKYLLEAKEFNPENYKILNNLLFVYIEKNELDKAQELLTKLESQNYEDEKVLLNKTFLLEKRGKEKEAEEIIREILKKQTLLKTPYFILAKKLFKQRKYLQVIEILSILKGYDPENPEVNYGLGITYLAIKKEKEGEEYIKEAIKYAPANVKYKKVLADYYYEKGMHEEAKNLYMQILSIDPNIPDVIFKVGNLFYKEGKMKEALKYYQDVLKLDPDNFVAKRNVEIIKKSING